MKKKFTMLLASLFLVMGTAWAQVYQKISHIKWEVTAPNQSATNGDEGGVAFIQDENAATFYHSDWGSTYEGRDAKKGADGLQGFMVDMGSVVDDITKITYTGRSDNRTSGWAKKVRIYLYESLPEGVPADLSTLSHKDKEALFAKTNTALGTAAFDNNESGEWPTNTSLKTAEFTEAKSARYVLFIQDVGVDSWLTCADFHVWQKIDGIVEDQPYYLKMTNIAKDGNEGDWYLDTNTPVGDNRNKKTIGKSATPVATYFTLNDGYWHISTMPGHESDFISVDEWCATPQSAAPANWTMEKNDDGSFYLIQNVHGTGSNRYLGGSDIINGSGNKNKVYTDQTQSNAVKFVFVALDEKQTAAEAARVALSYTGVGYPAADSEARTTLQAAVDAEDATAESIYAAITTYQSAEQTVLMPEAGKVYRLISGVSAFNPKKALYSDNVELKWQSVNASAMNQLWTVQCISDANMVMMNVNDALCPQSTAYQSLVKMSPKKNEATIDFLGKGQFRIKANKQQGIHANGHGGGTGNSGNTINYNTGADGASAWYFEEVAATKEILAAQIAAVKTSLLGSVLIEDEGIAGLQAAVDAAQAVHDADGNYAEAFAALVVAVNEATIDFIDCGYFYMKSRGGQKYAYYDGANLKAQADKTKKSVFKLTHANNGTFYVQCANGLYAQGVAQSRQTTIAAAPVEYSVSKLGSEYYVLRPTASDDGYQYWHQDGSSKIVGWSTNENNTQWTFEELTVEETAKIYTVSEITASEGVSISYNGTYDGGDKEVKQVGGFYVLDAAPAASDFTVQGSAQGSLSQVSVSGNDITVIEGISGENVYILRCKYGDSYARYHSNSQLSASDATNMLTYEGNMRWESLFYIDKGEGDYEGYYTIRPVAAPTLYAYNLKTANEDSKVAMKEAPAEGGLTANYYWKISSFGKEPGNITPHGGDDYGWNRRGNYYGYNHIGYWKGNNDKDDNKWFVRIVEEETIPLHSLDDDVIGYATNESATKVLPFAQVLSPAGLEKLKNAQFDVVAPETGNFYRLKNVASGNYMNGTTDGVNLLADGSNVHTTVFYLDENNRLLSFNTGRYLDCNAKAYAAVGTSYDGSFGFAYGGATANVVTYQNNGYWTYGAGGDGADLDRGTPTPNSTGYNWEIEKATWLPFPVNSTLRYGTLYSPVPLNRTTGWSADRVKAYTGSIEGDYLVLTEIEGNIPANTPVIVEMVSKSGYENGCVFLEILDDVAPLEVTNDLVGQTTAHAKSSEGTPYTLQSNDSDEDGVADGVVFRKYAGDNLSGFKSYLVLDETIEAQSIRIRFADEETTGIEPSTLNTQPSTQVYDLMGRKVSTMQKGGIYIVNGKKVIK